MKRIGLSGAMFGDDILTHLRVAGETGYGGVELRGMGPLLHGEADAAFLDQIDAALVRWNLVAVTLSTWLGCFALRRDDREREAELARSARFFALAARWKCGYVRVNPARLPPAEADDARWALDARWLARAADLARAQGVGIFLEMHHGTLCDTREHALRLLDLIARDNVGLVFDPYNLYQVPTDYGVEAIRALAPHIVNVHVKDLVSLLDDTYPHAFEYEAFVPHASRFIPVQAARGPRPKRYFANRLIGQGGIDWPHVVAALKAAGYQSFFTVEATSGKDPHMLDGGELAAHSHGEVARLLTAAGY
jgi:sugar phosphate isomerase/epimerase